MLEFARLWPFAFIWLPLLWLIWPRTLKQPKPSYFFPSLRALLPSSQQGAQITQSTKKKYTKQALSQFVCLCLFWLAFITAMAQPKYLGEPQQQTTQARELLIAMDLSGSMQQTDMFINNKAVTRIEAAHTILADFIERRTGDHIGLVVYADSAHLYTPPTPDLTAVAELALEAELGLVGEKTALGDAVALSVQYLLERNNPDAVIILLTDGMINAGLIDAQTTLEIAKNSPFKIYTIGIGADEMLVDSLFGRRKINPSMELDETFLTAIAELSGGQYFRGRSVEEMTQIYQHLDALEPLQTEEVWFRPQKSLIHWPLGFIFCLAFFLSLAKGLKQITYQLRNRYE